MRTVGVTGLIHTVRQGDTLVQGSERTLARKDREKGTRLANECVALPPWLELRNLARAPRGVLEDRAAT